MESPDYIVKVLREREGYDENDSSYDGDLQRLSPLEKLQHVTGWHLGSSDWAFQFIEWAEDCGFIITQGDN